MFWDRKVINYFSVLQAKVGVWLSNFTTYSKLSKYKAKIQLFVNKLTLSWSDISISDKTRNHLLLW